MSSVDLIEPPQQVLCGSVDIVATGVIWEVIAKRRSTEFLSEEIDFVQEQDDTRAHEPSRVDHRVEKN